MPIALHLTFHRAGAQGSVLADDLQRCNQAATQAWEHRVVELGVSGNPLGLVDLAGTQASLPELETALHLAQEVHLYGNDAESVLRELPYVKPEVLANTPLFVHGPCVRNEIVDPDSNVAHLKRWPGPVTYDLAAALSLQIAAQATPAETDLVALDPWSHLLTPRQGATGPIEGLAEDNAVIVCFSRALDGKQKASICERVEAMFCACEAPVDVGWIDESQLSVLDARKHRRLAQLFVSSAWTDPGVLESMMACTPFWVMDDEGAATLEPWLTALGVDLAQHQMPSLEDSRFDQTWQSAIDGWAQGDSLPAKLEYRQALTQRCVPARFTS